MANGPDILAIPNWSWSRAKDFARCGHQTLHVKVLKSVREEEGDAIINGKVVHKIIEDFVKRGVAVPASHKYLKDALEPFGWMRQSKTIELFIEHEMAVDRDFRPCPWFGRKAWGRARADLLAIEGDTGFLADFKTGKFSTDATEQLKLTAVLVFRHFPKLKKLTALARFLSPGTSPAYDTTTVEVYDAPRIWDAFVQEHLTPLAVAYQKSEWRKTPGAHCRWCPVASCEYHRSKQGNSSG